MARQVKGNMPVQTERIVMKRDKECKHSVRFAAPERQPGEPTPAVENVYVSRQADVDGVQTVAVTVEIG
jgi:hypothetical protein